MTLRLALRPYLPRDADALADLFVASIEILAEEDYSPEQRAAWSTLADDVPAFAARLAGALTLVVEAETAEGPAPVGFASLTGADTIDLLYVHPEHARLGIATTLVDALERLAAARGATQLKTDASDTAEPFFRARGFEPQQRNTVVRAGEWLGNTTMTKALAPAAAPETRQ